MVLLRQSLHLVASGLMTTFHTWLCLTTIMMPDTQFPFLYCTIKHLNWGWSWLHLLFLTSHYTRLYFLLQWQQQQLIFTPNSILNLWQPCYWHMLKPQRCIFKLVNTSNVVVVYLHNLQFWPKNCTLNVFIFSHAHMAYTVYPTTASTSSIQHHRELEPELNWHVDISLPCVSVATATKALLHICSCFSLMCTFWEHHRKTHLLW